MATITKSIVIKRPIEEVFDVATCLKRCVVWQASIVGSEKISEGPVGVGTRYRHQVKFLGIKSETHPVVTVWEPPHRMAYQDASGPSTFDVHFTCEPTPEGVKFTVNVSGEPKGVLANLTEPLLVPLLERQFESDLQALKVLMENEVPIVA
jgi:hypothetical protein